MAQATDTEILERCHAFETELDLRAAQRVEDLGDGLRAVLSPSIPLVWDANQVLIEEPGQSAAEIAAVADDVLGGMGVKHRAVKARRPADADELEAGFAELGWEVDLTLNLALGREPDRPPAVAAEEVDVETAWPTRLAFEQRDPLATPESDVQLLERARRIARISRDRWYATWLDGEVASACRLMQDDGIGQVEDVATLPRARKRGHARAVVLAAAAASRADGDELTFNTADATHWPLQLYERLGFDPVGVSLGFRIRPS